MGSRGVLNRKIGSKITVPPIDFGGIDKNLLLITNVKQEGPLCKNRKVFRTSSRVHMSMDVCWDPGLCCLVCGPLRGVMDGLTGFSAERPC